MALRTELVLVHKGETHTARTEDISEGGLLVATNVELELGDTVDVELKLPGAEALHVRAEVRRKRPGNRHALLDPGVGLMFLDLSEEERAFLHSFVMRRIKAILFRGV